MKKELSKRKAASYQSISELRFIVGYKTLQFW